MATKSATFQAIVEKVNDIHLQGNELIGPGNRCGGHLLHGELRLEWFWREQFQKRIEALCLAAVDLFGGELVGPPAPGAMVVPNSVDALLVTAGRTGREYSIPN